VRRAIERATKLARLDPVKRAYLFEAIGHLAWARLELSRKSSQAIVEGLQRTTPGLSITHGGADDLAMLSWAIRAGGAGVPWRSDCLVQSLAADRWLKRKGIAHDFRLGVRGGDSGQFLAHAWIEVDGIPITGGDDIGNYRLIISS
jgi:hypothetical protein